MIIGGKHYTEANYSSLNISTKLSKFLYVNGREGFASILKKIKLNKIDKIYIPNYICSSLLNVIKRFELNIHFYDIDNNFDFSIPNVKNSLILVINYFGKKKNIDPKLFNKNIIIEDKTLQIINLKKIQNFKKKNYYYFGSLRKIFTSLICGYSSILNKSKKKDYKIEQLQMECFAATLLRKEYLNNLNYIKSKKIEKIYLDIFKNLEIHFEKNLHKFKVNDNILNQLSKTSFKKEKLLRKENYDLIKKKINIKAKSNIIGNRDFTFFILFTKKKSQLIRFLLKYNIFLSNYWERPRILNKKKLSHSLYENLIYLPIDSIYSKRKINFMISKINLFIKKNGI